jgi:uncharacterized protein (TIGR02145 family)
MKYILKIIGLFLLILSIILFNSCKKDNPIVPTISTADVTGISTNNAVSGGNVTDDGGSAVISKGVCWHTSDSPVVSNSKTIESGGSGPFTSNISQLSPNITYYIRAYATNNVGTGYGRTVSFKTLGDKPISATNDASNILINSATLNGMVNGNSLTTVVTFEYGVTTAYGISIPAIQSPLTVNSNALISVSICNLLPGTTYHYRIKSENELGVTYSDDHILNTLGQKPTLLAFSITGLETNTVIVKASINPNYLPSALVIEYGITNNYGSSANPDQNSLTGGSAIDVNTSISGLTPGTMYYFRVNVQNDLGVIYGDGSNFITFNVMDADKNGYYTVQIGSQEWITKNLITTHFQNEDPIPNVISDYDWSALTSAGYCVYNNDNLNLPVFGNLYNFFAASDHRNVCPAGWHVPTMDDWTTLITYLGGAIEADKKIREAGTLDWFYNTGATNTTGFTMLGAGNRESDGSFFNKLFSAYVWSSLPHEENGILSGWNIGMGWNTPLIISNPYSRTYGASIRCLKN